MLSENSKRVLLHKYYLHLSLTCPPYDPITSRERQVQVWTGATWWSDHSNQLLRREYECKRISRCFGQRRRSAWLIAEELVEFFTASLTSKDDAVIAVAWRLSSSRLKFVSEFCYETTWIRCSKQHAMRQVSVLSSHPKPVLSVNIMLVPSFTYISASDKEMHGGLGKPIGCHAQKTRGVLINHMYNFLVGLDFPPPFFSF